VVQQPTPKPVGQKPPMPQAIPAPVQSPVIAMQNSILRDLPVVSVPEPIRPPGTWPPILSAPIVHPPVATRHDAYSHAHESHLADDPAPLPTARRSRRKGGHPLMLVGAALLLVASTHFALNANLSGSASAEAPVAQPLVDEADDYSDTPPPVDDEAVDEKPAPAAPATEASPRVTVAPARVQMTPGPAFAASAPTRPQPDSAARARSLAATPAPRPAPLQAPASIEPAPAAMDLDLPVIPGSDSIASAVKSRDSLAMKRILRALNGAKPADAKATP
jgi:hypothetical protein